MSDLPSYFELQQMDEIEKLRREVKLMGQLMKEMGEALKENGLSHDFDCGISVNGRHECSCGYLKSKEVLEKYRKFLEGIEK